MNIIRRAFAVLALCVAMVSAQAAEISTLTGKKYLGDIASITDGIVTFRTEAAGNIGIAVKDMFVVDFRSKVEPVVKGTKFDEIELIDGSIIRCSTLKIRGKKFEPTLIAASGAAVPKIDLPTETVYSLLRGADDQKNRDEWKQLLKTRGKRDLFVIKQADGFSPIPGTVLDGNEAGDAIDFERESDGQKVAFKLTRATGGIVFNQPSRGAIPPTVCRAIDVYGNVLTAKGVQLLKGGVLRITTVSGATFEYPTTAGLSKLDFSQGNIAYLSDLEPIVVAPMPAPGEPYFTYFNDKTDEKTAFKLDGTNYAKGVWIYPDTVLTYKLGGEYREFKAIVGIDESVQLATSVVTLTIEADGKKLFGEAISRKDKPRLLNLDVKGVKDLKITLERDGLFHGNQIDLAEARLQK